MSGVENEKKEFKATRQDVIAFTLHYWKPRKWMGLSSAALMLLSVATDAVMPVYTGKLVDAMTTHQAGEAIAWAGAWQAFWAFIFLTFAYHALRIASLLIWNKFAIGNLYSIVRDSLHKVQRFSSDWHANSFAGGNVRKITRGMWAFDSFEDTLLMGLLPAVTIMIGVTLMLTLALPAVGGLAAVMILLHSGFSIYISLKVLAPRFRESAGADTKVGATLADVLTGNPTVKSFGAEEREEVLFAGVMENWRKLAIRAWQSGILADAGRSALRVLMMTSMIALTIWLWKDGQATPGNIITVITSLFVIGGYLNNIGAHISHLQRAVSDMEDAIGFWLRKDDVVDAPGAVPLVVASDAHRGNIVFENVGFKYPNSPRIIYRDMNINIGAGEKLALVGSSGSGKSTFVKLIQRLYNVTEGQIRIDGQDIAGVTMQSLRRAVALVPQDPILFHRALAENIAYGKPEATMEEIVAASKKAYAHDFIMSLPQGYNTLVGERGVKLSGGERQRVAIARAILADAPILILDEATSSLDSISEHYIQLALDALTAGRTTITIAHRMSTIQKADRILVFDEGKIIEQGDHRSLMELPQSRYRALYEMQALGLIGDNSQEDEISDAGPVVVRA